MGIYDNEPFAITFLGAGVKINALENTASVNFGENFLQSLSSQVKNNFINGNGFGDFTLMNFTSISSPVFDPDGADTFLPSLASPIGLED